MGSLTRLPKTPLTLEALITLRGLNIIRDDDLRLSRRIQRSRRSRRISYNGRIRGKHSPTRVRKFALAPPQEEAQSTEYPNVFHKKARNRLE